MSDVLPFPASKPSRQRKRRILAATSLRALTPPATGSVDYFDDATPSLSLRVTANDVRTWTVFYRDKHARQKRLSLGRFPAVSLADARELAREAQLKVAKGGDPVLAKRAARDALTFGELADEYIQHHAKPNKKSWAEDQRQLDSALLPKWRNRPAVEVTAEGLLAVLNAKLRDGPPVAANRLRALVSRIFTFGAEQRRVPATANPVIGVKKPTKETTRDRVLTGDEIKRIFRKRGQRSQWRRGQTRSNTSRFGRSAEKEITQPGAIGPRTAPLHFRSLRPNRPLHSPTLTNIAAQPVATSRTEQLLLLSLAIRRHEGSHVQA